MQSGCKYWTTQYFPALDGLRALCAIFVVFNHLHVPYPRFIKGWFGVDVFFALSGFLVSTLLLRERGKFGSADLKAFYVRRFLRIVPVYFVILAAYPIAIWLAHDVARWHEFLVALPYLLFFMQEFRPEAAGTVYAHSWTLGYQEKFHLLWPWLLLGLAANRRRFWTVVIVAGGILTVMPPNVTRSYGELLLGSLLAILLHEDCRIHQWFHRLGPSVGLAVMALGYVLSPPRSGSRPATMLFALGACLLIGSLVLKDSWFGRVLQNRYLVLIGKRSYAIYLVHVLVLHVAEVAGQKLHVNYWWFDVPVTVAMSFAVSTALYYGIEKPLVAYGRQVSTRKPQREMPVAHATD